MHVFTHALYKNMCITESIIYYTINSHIKITQSALFFKNYLLSHNRIKNTSFYYVNKKFDFSRRRVIGWIDLAPWEHLDPHLLSGDLEFLKKIPEF